MRRMPAATIVTAMQTMSRIRFIAASLCTAVIAAAAATTAAADVRAYA